MFTRNSCVFHEACKKEYCSESCIRFTEFDCLLRNANIPVNRVMPSKLKLRPEDVDLEAFYTLADIKDKIVEFVQNGNNLYLYSNHCGNGKTTWALKLIMRYFNEIWLGNGYKPRGLFINVPTFMNDLRNNISQKSDKVEKMKRLISEVDVVIWDDIGAVNIKEFDHLVLLSYIDQRIVECKANIYTGNLSANQLEKTVGQRLFSRIWNNSTRIELKGSDRRGD